MPPTPLAVPSLPIDVLNDASADRIGALRDTLARPCSARREVDLRAELAWELRMSSPVEAFALGEEAVGLAGAGRFRGRPYRRGLAAALIAQAFVDTYGGRFAVGVSRCLEALALLELEPASALRVRAWLTLGWNSFFLGDYAAALENGLRALHLTRELGDRLHEAWVLDALASFHGVTGDFAQALPLHEESLHLFREQEELPGKLRALNNFSVSLHQVGRHREALAIAERSVALAEQGGFGMDLTNNLCTAAHILIDLGRLDEADGYLARALSRPPATVQVYGLQYRSRIRALQGDSAEAEASLHRALQLAVELDLRAEEAQCERALADLYEARGRFAEALAHFRRFHHLHQAVAGETVARRLDVLRITYQLDAAQHRAESYRRQTVALESQVEEQRRVREVLEHESRVDPLTNLQNRRRLDAVLAAEYQRHARSGRPLSLVMLDVDHFKAYNDGGGHVRGDECLRRVAGVLRASVRRPTDVAARFGGEEFVCILPETDHEGALAVAEEIRRGVLALGIAHPAGAGCVTVSLGVITAPCSAAYPVESLLAAVDEQLYVAKSAGRNRVAARVFPG